MYQVEAHLGGAQRVDPCSQKQRYQGKKPEEVAQKHNLKRVQGGSVEPDDYPQAGKAKGG